MTALSPAERRVLVDARAVAAADPRDGSYCHTASFDDWKWSRDRLLAAGLLADVERCDWITHAGIAALEDT